jgi:hypothetical protein
MATVVMNRSRLARIGWVILLGVSGLLFFAGVSWYFGLPQMALENIAERTSLAPDEFKLGESSAFAVITVIARGYGIGYAALGLQAFLVGLEGYRNGSQWAWKAMWVVVATFAAIAVNFMRAGETVALSLGILVIGIVALAGLLLARSGQAG